MKLRAAALLGLPPRRRPASPPAAPGRATGRRPATAGRPVSVAAFYPLQFATQRVGGDHVDGHQPDPARRRAARPRAEPEGRRRGHRGRPRRLPQGLPAGGRRRGRPARAASTPSTSRPPPPRPRRSGRGGGRRRRRQHTDAPRTPSGQGPALLARPDPARGRRRRHRDSGSAEADPASAATYAHNAERCGPSSPRSTASSAPGSARARARTSSPATRPSATSRERYGMHPGRHRRPLPRRRAAAAPAGPRSPTSSRPTGSVRSTPRPWSSPAVARPSRRDRRAQRRARPDGGPHQRLRGRRLPRGHAVQPRHLQGGQACP